MYSIPVLTKSEKYYIQHGYLPKGVKSCHGCEKSFTVYLTRDLTRKRFCSPACFGKINSKQKKLVPPHPATWTEEMKQKASLSRKANPRRPKPINPFDEVTIKYYCPQCGDTRSSKGFGNPSLDAKCVTCSNSEHKQEIVFNCDECGSLRKRPAHQYQGKHRFCDGKCRGKWKTRQPSKVRVSFSCPHCSKVFERYRSQRPGKQVFCSRPCNVQHHARRGKDSHLFKNGNLSFRKAIKRNKTYKSWCKSVYTRDGFKCRHCGSAKTIHAHHIIHFATLLDDFLRANSDVNPISDKNMLLERAFRYAPFWDINNGKTLCQLCHQKEHPDILLLTNPPHAIANQS